MCTILQEKGRMTWNQFNNHQGCPTTEVSKTGDTTTIVSTCQTANTQSLMDGSYQQLLPERVLVVRVPISRSFGQGTFLEAFMSVLLVVLGWRFYSALLRCMGGNKETGRLNIILLPKSQCPQAAHFHISETSYVCCVMFRFFSCIRELLEEMG